MNASATDSTANKKSLIYCDITPISSNKDAERKVNRAAGYNFARSIHAVPVVKSEINAVAVSYPIIFATEKNIPFAALGVKENVNVFVGGDFSWLSDMYIPGFLRRYPFITAKVEDGDEVLCIDTQAEHFNESENAEALFDSGNPAPFTKKMFEFCVGFEGELIEYEKLCETIKDLGLFCIKTIEYPEQQGGEKLQFTAIDDKVFASLTADEFLQLRDTPGALDLIYAHFTSLLNWNRVVAQHARTL